MVKFGQDKTDRRKFFSVAGKTTLGAMLLSAIPFKLFAATPKYHKIKKVSIHKEAVKRVK